jgi:hypothetical protein
VTLTRLQDSLDVAARTLAPSKEAFDTTLCPSGSHPQTVACYRGIRLLPGRDFHPLVQHSFHNATLVQSRSCAAGAAVRPPGRFCRQATPSLSGTSRWGRGPTPAHPQRGCCGAYSRRPEGRRKSVGPAGFEPATKGFTQPAVSGGSGLSHHPRLIRQGCPLGRGTLSPVIKGARALAHPSGSLCTFRWCTAGLAQGCRRPKRFGFPEFIPFPIPRLRGTAPLR